MKKMILSYYSIFIIFFFIVTNLFLDAWKISGIVYDIFLVLLIVFNIIILTKLESTIKFKNVLLFSFLLLLLSSKNIYYILFCISTVVWVITRKINTCKPIEIVIGVISMICFTVQMLFLWGLIYSFSNPLNSIYSDTHYYCQSHYEIYAYSGGAFDSFHYSIGKYYEILHVNNILNISYHKRNEVSLEKYEEFLNSHTCRLVDSDL